MIECCINCVAPKRHLGCHHECHEYIIDKAVYDIAVLGQKRKERSAKIVKRNYRTGLTEEAGCT